MDQNTSLESLFLGSRLPLGGLEVSLKFYLPLRDFLKNVFILGETGSGRTVLGKAIIEEAAAKHVNCLLVDFKGDVSSLGAFFDKVSSPQLAAVIKGTEGSAPDGGRIQKEYDYHLKQMSKYGLGLDHIKDLKDNVEVAVFTPLSEQGIPLAVSSLANPPARFNELGDDDKAFWDSALQELTTCFIQRLYPATEEAGRGPEGLFLKELVLYCWQQGWDLEGLSGMARLIELADAAPIERVAHQPLDKFISPDRRQQFVQRLNEFLYSREQLWYQGLPMDPEIFYRKTGSGKNLIAILNLSFLEDARDVKFVLMRLFWAVYRWLVDKGQSLDPRLFLYLDELTNQSGMDYCGACRPPNTGGTIFRRILEKGSTLGAACVLSTRRPEAIDPAVAGLCATWMIGEFHDEESRTQVFTLLTNTPAGARGLENLLSFPRKRDFLVRGVSGEVALLETRWLAGYHAKVPAQACRQVMSPETIAHLRAFYVLDSVHDKAVALAKSLRAKSALLIPEIIYESFDFGGGADFAPFVLDIEPEEAIRLLLKELAKENIGPEEMLFLNAQLDLARVYRGDWKVDTLVREQSGRVTSSVKDEGVYFRCDSSAKLEAPVKEKMATRVLAEPNSRGESIAKKVFLAIPVSGTLSEMEVKSQIGRDLGVHPKEVHAKVASAIVALSWSFTIEYKRRIITCGIDVLSRAVTMVYPEFSADEAFNGIITAHPELSLRRQDLLIRPFSYQINHPSQDRNYEFTVSKNSGKIMRQRTYISFDKAKVMARSRFPALEPLQSWKHEKYWNFYYPDGSKVTIDEESEELIERKVISQSRAQELACQVLSESLPGEQFDCRQAVFKEGIWFLVFASRVWEAELEVHESGKVFCSLVMNRVGAQRQAERFLAQHSLPVSSLQRVSPNEQGWLFDFVTPFGGFSVSVTAQACTMVSRRFTVEGLEYYVKNELKASLKDIIDREEFWDIIITKANRTFCVSLSKQDGAVQKVRKKELLFWIPAQYGDIV